MSVNGSMESIVHNESTKIQLAHINETLAGLASKVDVLIDMTKTVAVLKVEADNHRDYTQQMEVRLTQTTAKLEANLDAEEASRIHANKHIHDRVDVVKRWMYVTGGGITVIVALLGYAGETIKGFADTYVRYHATAARQELELEHLRQQVVDLQRIVRQEPSK